MIQRIIVLHNFDVTEEETCKEAKWEDPNYNHHGEHIIPMLIIRKQMSICKGEATYVRGSTGSEGRNHA